MDTYSSTSVRSKTLMETLLGRKIAVAASETDSASVPQLFRSDSMDSVSSIGSCRSAGDDICSCDDCVLGITDLYMLRLRGKDISRKVISKYLC